MSIERVTSNPAAGFVDTVTTSGAGRTIYVSGNVGFGPDEVAGLLVDAHIEIDAVAFVADG